MSYTALIPFKNGQPLAGQEFRNAWGGAARIWTSLWDAYLKVDSNPFASWMSGEQSKRLWALAERKDISLSERAVLAFTFDLFYVRRENFKQMAVYLRAFKAKYPLPNAQSDHLESWAVYFARASLDEIEAIGLYATSVGENLWSLYDGDKDEMVNTPLSKGTEVYEYLGIAQIKPEAFNRQEFVTLLNAVGLELHQTAQEKGWWQKDRNDGELIALMHSELSEALEGLRHNNPPSDHIPDFTAAEEELADCIIRILDMGAARGYRIAEAILAKADFNNTRAFKHGGKQF